MENDNSDINIDLDDDIDIEEIADNAINGNTTSLDQLIASPWLAGVLEEITTRLARQFDIDRTEIRDEICDKLRGNITTIENPGKGPLSKCIRKWCNSTGTHFCLNEGRHRKVEYRYVDRVIHENIHGVRKSAKGTIIVLQSPATNSPEDIMLQEEEDSLWATRKADLHSAVYRAITKLPPEDINITLLWAQGLRLKDIAQVTGSPLSTVQRHLKKSQKQILDSIGIRKLVDGDDELTKGAYQLIASCMLEMNRGGYFPQQIA